MLCDDGTTCRITDLRLWEEPEPCPPMTRRLPGAGVAEGKVRFKVRMGTHIRNLYGRGGWNIPLRRDELSGNCGRMASPTLNLHLGISAQNVVQMFWPWQEHQLTQVFRWR